MRGGGLFSSHEEYVSTHVWKVQRLRPDGDTDYIDQTSGWENRCVSGLAVAGGGFSAARDREPQLHALIARLGVDAWEPIPLVIVGGETRVSSHVEWYCERHIPDDAP